MPRITHARLWPVMITLALLAACSGISQKEAQRIAAIDQLNALYESNQNSPTFLLKRAGELEALAMSQSSEAILDKALADYQRVLEQDPANNGLRFKVYNILFNKAISHGEIDDALVHTYSGFDTRIKTEINPPALARYFWLSRMASAQTDDEALRLTMHRALQESPGNPEVLRMASHLFDYLEEPATALLFAKRAYEKSNASAPFSLALAKSYNAYISRNACPYDYPRQLAKTAELLQPLLRDKEAGANAFEEAFTAFERLNAWLPWYESAKALQRIQASPRHTMMLAEVYNALGRRDLAQALFAPLLDQNKSYVYRWAMLLNASGDFSTAQTLLDREIHRDTGLWLYDVLAYESLRLLQDQNYKPGQLMDRVDMRFASEWERALLRYWQGHSSEEVLHSSVQNQCQSTEALFYSALRNIHAGHQAQGVDKLRRIVQQRLYSFSEYDMARQLLEDFGELPSVTQTQAREEVKHAL